MNRLSVYIIFLFLASISGSVLLSCKNWDLPGEKSQRVCTKPSGTLSVQAQQRRIDATITGSSGTIDQIVWNFGDGETTTTTSLTVSHTYQKEGTYTVKATLSNTCTDQLILQRDITIANPVAPTVTLQPVSGVSTTSATSGVTITNTGNSTITRYGICWSTTNQMPTISDQKAEASGSPMGNVSNPFGLTGLSPNTRYYVRGYATNSVGTGYSAAQSFVTGQDPAVSTVAATNAGITTATANFIVNTAGNPAAVEYGICYSSNTSDPNLTNSTVKPIASPALGINVAADLTDLVSNKTYFYRAYAKTATGEVIYGEVFSFTTKVDTLAEDLVASVSFTDRSLNDISGFNNHVKLMGSPTFTTDRKGRPNAAILLNGTGDYFLMPENPNNSLNPEAFTISIWIRPGTFVGRTRDDNKRMQIFNKSRFTDSAFERYSSAIKLENDIGPGITFISNIKQGGNCQQGKGWQDFLFTSNVNLQEWHHLVLVYSGRSAQMYFDNLLLYTKDNLPADRIDDCRGGDLKFGGQYADLPWYFSGAMDDIRIYKRALSKTEVQTLFNQ